MAFLWVPLKGFFGGLGVRVQEGLGVLVASFKGFRVL